MSIIGIAINAFVMIFGFVIVLAILDDYIKRLVDRAVDERCGNCEFKKSEIQESQRTADISEF